MKSCCEHHRIDCQQGDFCPLRKPKKLNLDRLKVPFCLACFFLAYGVMGTMDYEDALAAQAYSKPTQTAQGGDTR